MGQRANLVIVENGKAEIYYTHHRANSLDYDLFWGPSHTFAFIRAQQRSPNDELLDEIWAEGGAVLDVDRRELLWFGGEDMMYEIVVRHVHAEWMSRVWSGWKVRWAVGGVADMVAHLGYSRESVLSSELEPAAVAISLVDAIRPGDLHESETIACVRTGPIDWRSNLLAADCQKILYSGPPLVAAIEADAWPTGVTADWSKTRQTGGFVVDVPAKTVDFWMANARRTADVQRRVASCWPGWAVTWHGDELRTLLQLAGGHVQIVMPDRKAMVTNLWSFLLRPDAEHRRSGADAVLEVAHAINAQSGLKITGINPVALFDAVLSIPLDARIRLLNAAMDGEP